MKQEMWDRFFRADTGMVDAEKMADALEGAEGALRDARMGVVSEDGVRKAVWVYEEMMGGERLPDGDGYDGDIIRAIVRNALDPLGDDDAIQL